MNFNVVYSLVGQQLKLVYRGILKNSLPLSLNINPCHMTA